MSEQSGRTFQIKQNEKISMKENRLKAAVYGLETCDSIRECGKVDCNDMQQKFKEWLYDAKYTVDDDVFDAGNTTIHALQCGRGIDGIPTEWVDKLRGKEIIDKCLF